MASSIKASKDLKQRMPLKTSERKILWSIYLSNSFEFFDYTLFGSLSVMMHRLFFPATFSLNTAVLTFCLSLVVRPLGSLIFGWIGDRVGRAQSLKWSLSTMVCASLMVALCPTYETAGTTATVIIVFSRMLQGISAGGEYNGAAIFAMENLTFSRWKISSFLTSSAIMGLVLSLGVSTLINLEGVPDWGWRLGFLVGGVIGFVSLSMRRRFQQSREVPEESLVPTTHGQFYARFFIIFLIGGQTSSLGYFIFMGLAPYLKHYGRIVSHDMIAFTLLAASLTCIAYTYLIKVIRLKKLVRLSLAASGLVFPAVIAVGACGWISLPLTMMLAGVALGCHGSLQHALFFSLVRYSMRQRFISLAFSMGTGVLASLVLVITQNQSLVHLGWFAIVSFLAWILLIYEETHNENLY